MKETQKSLKSQAASLAAEYKKQGMSASDAFKKAWSEIERSSEVSADAVEKDWKNSSTNIGSAISRIGSITAKGLKVAATAIAGTATALGGVATAAIKVGSDFEAQMSRVKAISGATSEEFEQLRNQAIELGADTSFSASEAAQGMENLAAAGFTTNEIMSAMPGMLDLAAASGENLASSADIAASTLRGFGLEASEAGHVADVLAENANRTNSSVAETGEAMKYIAPLARAAGISMEETAAAIGIMANAGIQGSQAGTTLRGALSRLSKPTDVMQQAMDELGVSFYDSEGKMLSLAEQVGMLQSAMEGMTDEQKNNYLVTLYGQEALSGMLALINEGPESLSGLTAAYESCDGAAQAAATTMQDNLKGAVEALSGSAETLGIVFYDSVSGSLKDAVQVVNESVDNITDAFNNGGMDEAISSAGDEFANLSIEAAKHAPDMVDTAADFIEAFGSGIVRNSDKLLDSAEEVAVTLAGGLARLLPDELQEPVEDAIDAISDSLNSGGLKEAGDTLRRSFETAIDVVGELADVALPLLSGGLDLVGDNLNHVVALAGGAAAAFATYRTATTAAATATAIAEKAQQALNFAMNANPALLVASGIIAIVSALAIYSANFDQASAEQEQFNAEMDELNSKIEENRNALDNLSASMKETNESMDASAAPLERLKGKLDDAFDSTGRVKEGSEELAQSILNQLNEAMGTEYSLTADGFIQNNEGVKQSLDQVSDSIDQYVQSLKRKALSEAVSDQYAEAIQQQAEAQATLSEAQEKYNDALKNYAEVSAEYAQSHDYKALGEAEQRLNDTRVALEETTGAAAEADATVSGLDSIMDSLGEGTPESIQKAIDAYAQLPTEAQNAGNGIVAAQQIIQTALASTDYSTMVEGFRLAAEQIEASGGEIPLALQNSIASAIGKFSELSPEAQTAAIEMMRNMMQSLEKSGIEFADDAATMPSEEVLNTFSQYLVDSGAMNGIGVSSVQDLVSGLAGSEAQTAVTSAASAVSTAANIAFGSADTEATGRNSVVRYSAGAASQENTASSVAAAVSNAANIALGSANTNATGRNAGAGYVTGVSGQSEAARRSGRALADSADSGASSKTGYDAGYGFGSGFVSGVNEWVGSAVASAANLAAQALLSAKQEIDSNSPAKETIKLGKYFGQGFEIGIDGEVNAVEKSSENLANAALKSLDMSAISARMRETMALNTDRIARSFAIDSSSTIISKQQTENLMKLSDADIDRLAAKLGKATANGVSKGQSNRPIYIGTDRIDKPLPKGAVPRI